MKHMRSRGWPAGFRALCGQEAGDRRMGERHRHRGVDLNRELDRAREILLDAYDGARLVGYRVGSRQMVGLHHAERTFQEVQRRWQHHTDQVELAGVDQPGLGHPAPHIGNVRERRTGAGTVITPVGGAPQDVASGPCAGRLESSTRQGGLG